MKRKKILKSPGLSLYLSKQNGLLTHGFKWKTLSWSMFWNFPNSRISENKNNLSISAQDSFQSRTPHFCHALRNCISIYNICKNNILQQLFFILLLRNEWLSEGAFLFVCFKERFINTFIKGLESGQSILKIHAWIIFLYWLSSQTVNISIANNTSTGIVPLNKYFLHLNLKQLLLELKQLELWLFLSPFLMKGPESTEIANDLTLRRFKILSRGQRSRARHDLRMQYKAHLIILSE